MKKLIGTLAVAIGLFATTASANPAHERNDAREPTKSAQANFSDEFKMDVDPGVLKPASRTGRLIAFDLEPAINVGQGGHLFGMDLRPGINLSSRTQGLFDFDPHINVR